MVQIVKRASDVRTSEINLSQVLVSSSTSVACLPIVSKQGTTKPWLSTNGNDFLAEYGNPDPSVSMSIQAGLNYLSEGNQLWGLRVVGTGAMYAGVLLYNDTDGTTKLKTQPTSDPLTADLDSYVTAGQTAIALFYPSHGQGSYANTYGISVVTNNLVAPTAAVAVSATVGTLDNGTYSYTVAALALTGETLGSLPVTITRSGLVAPTGANDVSWPLIPGAVGYAVYGRDTSLNAGRLATLGATVTSFTDTGALTPDTTHQPITNSSLAYSSASFAVNVYDGTQNVESWTCTLGPNVDSTGTQTEIEDRINPFSGYVQVVSNVAGALTMPVVKSVSKVTMAGGNSGAAPTSSQIALAMQVFLNKQLYKTNLFINAGMADPVLQLALDTLVQARGESIALLDVPSTKQQHQAATDYRNIELNLNSTYSALFSPDLLQADLINGQQVYNPPSGWVAALCARTDRVANSAFSPAGLNRGLVPVLKQRYQFDDGEATHLFDNQVNYFRTFDGQGIALWEQQTLSGSYSALSWISVRRIVNTIKISLYQFLLYALQEMPTDAVRRQLVNGCESFLFTVQNSSGLYSFNVTCDNSNNPPAAANAGILVLTVTLVPSIPIHEVQLQIVISKQGVTFAETLRTVNGNTQ